MPEAYRAVQGETSPKGRESVDERERAHDTEQEDADRRQEEYPTRQGLFHDRVVSWGQHGHRIPIGSDP